MKNFKKVLILGIALLIIAGIVVVGLKGVKASLLYGKHECIELKLNKEIDFEKVSDVCKDVFGKRRFEVKKVEMFNDSFQLNVEYITDEEKATLVSKINEQFETGKTVEDLVINTVSKIRIRDSVKIYIAPMIVAFISAYIYILIRFRRIKPLNIIFKNFYKTILTEACLVSVIAIARIPVFSAIFAILAFVAIGELVYCITKAEKENSEIKVENKKCV